MQELKMITNLVPTLTLYKGWSCPLYPDIIPFLTCGCCIQLLERLAANPRVISHLGNLRGGPQIHHSSMLPNQMHLPVHIQHQFSSPPRDAKNCHVDNYGQCGGGLSRDIPVEHIKVKRPLNQLLGANSTCWKAQWFLPLGTFIQCRVMN